MNTTSNLIILEEAPTGTKRTDTIHASIIGVMVFSIVFHAIIGLVVYSFVDSPETKKSQQENIVHQVRLSPKTHKPEPNPSKKPEDSVPYIKELDKTVKDIKKPDVKEKPATVKTVEKDIKPSPKVAKPKPVEKKIEKPTITESKPVIADTITEAQEDNQDGLIQYNATKEEKERLHRATMQALNDNFNRILTLWVKPRDYERRLTGVIDITLNDNGDIISTKISKPSGDFTLDLSVMEAIKRAKRFSQPTIGKLPRHFNFEYDSDMR